MSEENMQIADFGAGCFWCVEAVFQNLKGVEKVLSGFEGGNSKQISYEEVCTGTSGHAEVVRIHYNQAIISFAELLEIFWHSHDPTTPNRQGNDIGSQYRSVIFYHSEEQKKQALDYKQKLDDSGVFDKPICTEIVAASEFFPAENYHQNYYKLNPEAGYCQYIIKPKVDKIKKVFAEKIK